jgi:Na+/H+-translocating membrane pyrophosphatase
MISSLLCILLVIASVSVAFNFASFYGIALCAVGVCSITPAITGISGLSIVSGTASEIMTTEFGGEEYSDASNALETASIRSCICGRSYTISASVFAALGMLTAIVYSTEIETISLFNVKTITGLFGGAVIIPVLFGLIIWSIRTTGTVAVRVMRHDDDEGATGTLRGSIIPPVIAIAAPAITGLFFGLNVLLSFLTGAVISCCIISYTINNSGQYFERTAIQSLSTLLKMMIIFTALFIPAFIRIGGFIF